MAALETLRKNWEFQQAFRAGKSIAGREIVMYAAKNRRGTLRFGFCVSKKVGGAVVRNQVRRRLKEICRAHLPYLRKGWDVVLVARSDAANSDYARLFSAFQAQGQRLGCWSEQTAPVPVTA